MTLRLVFMGTPHFSVPTLDAILAAGHDVVGVYSQPPRRAGRGMIETKGEVHAFAEARGLQVHTPISLKDGAAEAVFRSCKADAAIVVAYGLLLPQAILDAPRLGCYNLHASALPRWRGAAPIQRAIMAGDTATASVVMRMEAGLDTGPMCAVAPLTIGPAMTAGELHDALSIVGARLMVEALADLEAGRLTLTEQPTQGVTYAAKIDKAEAKIDFARPANDVHNQVRGLSPFPGAWFEAPTPGRCERIKVLRVSRVPGEGPPGTILDDAFAIACGGGAIRLEVVQRAGKRPQTAAEFGRGFELTTGQLVK
jgi:methionyl-tRNA formyltransferase